MVESDAGGPTAGADEERRAAEGLVLIQASPERVWRALTEATDLVRWFPLEARVDPGEDGSVFLSWKNEYQATSRIVAWEPPLRLAYSWGWSEDEAPQVTEYRVEAREGVTRLHVVTSGFPADASWDDLVEGTRLGWAFELRSLRMYLEGHDGEPRHVAYVRRAVPLTREEVSRRLFGPDGPSRQAPPGRAFDVHPPLQHACAMDRPEDGLFRLSNEASHGAGRRVATVWISAWGDHAAEVAGLGEEWRARLARAFPDGVALPD